MEVLIIETVIRDQGLQSVIGVVLVSLLLTLNMFHTYLFLVLLLRLWTGNCFLGGLMMRWVDLLNERKEQSFGGKTLTMKEKSQYDRAVFSLMKRWFKFLIPITILSLLLIKIFP